MRMWLSFVFAPHVKIGVFFRHPISGLVGRMLVLLLRCHASTDRMVTAKSHLTIHALAEALGLTLMDLYTRHRQFLALVSILPDFESLNIGDGILKIVLVKIHSAQKVLSCFPVLYVR